MRILVLLSNPGVGGTETFILSVTPHLEKMGCGVDILNVWHDSLMKKRAFAANLSYKELSGNSRYISLRDLVGVLQIVRRNEYDIVLTFGFRISIILRLSKSFFKDTLLVIGLRGIDIWRRWYHTWLDRLTQGACDMFIPNCGAVAKAFITREKFSSDNIVVIKNGIALEEFNRNVFQAIDKLSLGLPHRKIIITTIANLRHEKGYDFYVKVIEKFFEEFKNVYFVWVGIGKLKRFLVNKMASIDARDKLTILSKVSDVRPILTCSDIFVLPSREEGMPRALMEAMAMSLPCVATDVGGVREVIENGLSGLIADFGDVENFGRHIVNLINNKNLRCKMGMAARQRVTEDFDIRKISEKYAKLFELVASGQRSGRQIQQQIDS